MDKIITLKSQIFDVILETEIKQQEINKLHNLRITLLKELEALQQPKTEDK